MDDFCGSVTAVSNKTEYLRRRLDDLGCVFEFVTMVVDKDISIDDRCHRSALSELYEQIMASQRAWYRKVVRVLPAADYPVPTMRWDLSSAVGVRLSRQQIISLMQVEANEFVAFPLYADFIRPLCFSKQGGNVEDTHLLFGEWIDALGLHAQDGVEVLSWAGEPRRCSMDTQAGKPRSAWTEFLCPGSQAQHVWCLTIWNPVRRTMAALAACSTARK